MNNEDLILKMILDESGFTSGMNNAVKKLGDFDGQVSKTGEKGGRSLGGIWTSFVGNFLASGAVKIISAGMNVIRDSVGGAIERYDKLSQFPKVLSALGASTKEAESATNKLKEGIDGLPTTLQDVASTTQQMYSVFKNADTAADSTIALNNALLASGSSGDKAARGTDQYLKVLRTGKFDMDSYSTLQETMGVGLDKIAEKFKFTGASAQNDLYNALKKGDITINEFNQALIDIQDGLDGTANVARTSTEGIGTSMTNLRNSVKNGLAGTIEALDNALKDAGFGGFAGIADKLKVKINELFKAFNNNLPNLIEKVGNAFQFLADNATWLIPVISGVAGALASVAAINAATSTITNITKAVGSLSSAFSFLMSPTGLIIVGIGLLIAAGVALYKNWDTISDYAKKIWGGISDFFKNTFDNIKGWFSGLWEGSKEKASAAADGLRDAWSGTKEWFSDTWNGIKNGAKDAWDSAVQSGKDAVNGVKDIWNGIKEWFTSLWNGVKESVSSIVGNLADAIMSRFGMLIYGVRNAFIHMSFFLNTLWENLVKIAANIFDILKNVILAPVLFVTSMITGGWEEARDNMIAVWNNIQEAAGNIWNSIKDIFDSFLVNTQMAFSNVWNGIKAAVSYIWSSMLTIATDTFNSIVAFFVETWANVKQTATDTWTNIKDSVAATWQAMLQGARDTFDALKNFLADLWQSTKNTAIDTWESIKSGVTNAWNTTKDSVVNTAKALVQGAQKAWEDFKQGISDAVNRAREIFDDLRSIDLFEIGKNIIKGLIDGIGSMFNAVKDTITGIADTIKGGITGALGIHSPSRWMRDMIGKNIVLGVVRGIEEEKGSLDNAVTKMTDLPTEVPTIQVKSKTSDVVNTSTAASGQTAISNDQSDGDTYHIHLQAMGEPSEAQMMSWAKTIVKYINEVKERDYAPKGGAFGGI